MIAHLLEKASGMSDQDILLKLKSCTRGELLDYMFQLRRSREDLQRELGHPYRRVSDGDGPLSQEYDLLSRLTSLVKVAMFRKRFEKPLENVPPALAAKDEKMTSEGVNQPSTGEEDLAAASVRDKAASQETSEPVSQPGGKRRSATISSELAAKRLEEYLTAHGIGLTEFATKAKTTDKTLREFRKTGKVRRDIFDAIAKAMGTTREDLLKPD